MFIGGNPVIRMIALCLLVITCNSCTTGIKKKETLMINNVKSLLENQLTVNGPGIQYIMVNKEETLFEFSGGLSNIEKKQVLISTNTMAAFSMTKTLTAIAILQLVQSNKISLADPLSMYVKHPYTATITIKQLLSHTSGIPDPIPLNWVHLSSEQANFNEEDALKSVLNKYPKVNAQPGSEYGYSNIGYWLLGRVIEQVSGKKYSDYVTENILDVLGITKDELSFYITDTNNHAQGYLKKWSMMNIFGRLFIDSSLLGKYEGGWLHIKDVYLNGPSFGGAIGTAAAFSKILQDLLADKPTLLNAETLKLLYEPQRNNTGKSINMTLGWHINTLAEATYYFKEGGGAGFHSEMRIYPERGLASVIMTNRTAFNSNKVLSELDSYFMKK